MKETIEIIDNINIRNAKINDISRINDIHNQAIIEKFKVAYLEPWTENNRLEWFEKHTKSQYPIYVSEIDNVVNGYVYLQPYRYGREALKQTAEISFFVDKNYRGKGIGKKLINYTELECRKLNINTLIAIILDINNSSVNLIERCGYEKWGHLLKIAVIDNIEIGHLYYGKRLCL
jgi:phosphinothricin acetyltransferase